MEQAFFLFVAVVATASGLAVVMARNPIHSALALIVCFVQVAAVFLLLRAPLLAVIQMFVYVGAVIILFLFVIMMLDVRKEIRTPFLKRWTAVAVTIVVLLAAEMFALLLLGEQWQTPSFALKSGQMSSVRELSIALFTEFLFPFEIASVILLVALVGAIILTRKETN
ncbi:NADH-quinone oxidoreductase subunit J [Pelagibius sp. Alg239-R121]|uniref:NADH-quinone oxidoreductase subunit J family protein n=1 Tax=Pelagibius sp. Alg239-R121 TaxID=2993448 RepID=UPI0024A66641|nr:NADH-quinone oxidoreductase subunit J [Pelagibius sp. Alg239-R121]